MEAVVSPIVIALIPVVKMYQETIVHHIRYRSNTDDGGTLFVCSLQLHSNPKAWWDHRLRKHADLIREEQALQQERPTYSVTARFKDSVHSSIHLI